MANLFSTAMALDSGAIAVIETAKRSVIQISAGRRGIGTGTVWRVAADGVQILTNAHVVAGRGAAHGASRRGGHALHVLDRDHVARDVTVLRRDDALDLALLHLAPDAPGRGDLLPARFAALAPRVGELVFAIGNPWGEEGVVTRGVISATGEVAMSDGRRARYLRSDVRLAPGNSGGPLLNAAGEVVGINAMIVGGDLSVAIPSATIVNWLQTSI